MCEVIDATGGTRKLKRRYTPRAKKLVLAESLLQQITALSQIQCTQKEAAKVIGVSHRLLVQFLAEQPEARVAWDRGRAIGRFSLRRLLWKQAQVDPAQARFLGKHWLKMDGNPPQRAADNDPPALSHEERIARIRELQAKVRAATPAVTPTDLAGELSAAISSLYRT
jgi:hypothetical protein